MIDESTELSEELLQYLRGAVGLAHASFAEAPQRLGGGFFTENHSFRLAGVAGPWDGPLVLRLFPRSGPDDLSRREAAVQTVVADQGYPAPRVIWFREPDRLSDRRFFVMERLPGQTMMGGIGVGEVVRTGWSLLTRLATTTAEVQKRLHALDATPLIEELPDLPVGIDRWLALLEAKIDAGASGFADGWRWLVEHQPRDVQQRCICHGDLWAGNILVDDKQVSGVLDWTVVTVAEPALDVGFTTMALSMAPVDVPRAVQPLVARVGRSIAHRYVREYQRGTPIDLARQPYYEALRCAGELAEAAAWRIERAAGNDPDVPRPVWDSIADRMVEYFRARTGVALELPPDPTSRT